MEDKKLASAESGTRGEKTAGIPEGALFLNRSPLGPKENSEYHNDSLKKSFSVTVCVVVTVFLALGLVSILLIDEYVLGAILLALAVVYAFLPLILIKSASSKKYMAAFVEEGLENVVEVREDTVRVASERQGIKFSDVEIRISDLRSADVNKEYIYLYIAKNQAYILTADKFILGDAPAFLRFLEKKGVKVKYK